MSTSLNRRNFLAASSGATASLALSALARPHKKKADAPPNFLWLSIEDAGAHLGCYDDEYAYTPAVDMLAAQGTRFTNVCCNAGVCAPSRAGIITGMYPSSLGANHMRCKRPAPDYVKGFAKYLKDAGYYCINNSKTDYQGTVKEYETWDSWSGSCHYKNRSSQDTPFFGVFNTFLTHEFQYKEGTEEARAIGSIPPYYPDTEVAKKVWTKYYDQMTAMDAWVDGKLKELDELGLTDNTIVMFWSDHGVGLPRGKRWLYDSGLRVPLVVRIPSQYRVDGQGMPGTVDDRLISMLDLAPTMLNLAGIDRPEHMVGSPFLGANVGAERQYIHAARDRIDERYDFVRCVRTKTHIYIRNFEPWKPYSQYVGYCEEGQMMQEYRSQKEAGTLSEAAALYMAPHRPIEELYDLRSDPFELRNLARKTESGTILTQMRQELKRWMCAIRDVGFIPEAELDARVDADGNVFESMRTGTTNPVEAQFDFMEHLSRGSDGMSELAAGLAHEDPAIRYWAAIGLGNLTTSAADHVGVLAERLTDISASVRIAAARALCYQNKADQGVPVLAAEISGSAALLALNVVDELGSLCAPLKPDLEAMTSSNDYVKRILVRILATIEDAPRDPAVDMSLGTRRNPPASAEGAEFQLASQKNRLYVYVHNKKPFRCELFSLNGSCVARSVPAGQGRVSIETKYLAAGGYLVRAFTQGRRPVWEHACVLR